MRGPDTTGAPDSVEFNGVTYRLMGGVRRYYLSQAKSTRDRKGAKGLHVAVWEFYSGQRVPPGRKFNVHHRDENTFNNFYENLECISRRAHIHEHPLHDPEKQARHLAAIRPLSTAWHRSPEGREWHSRHMQETQASLQPRAIACVECGAQFQGKYKNRRFCSTACGNRYRARLRGGWPKRPSRVARL